MGFHDAHIAIHGHHYLVTIGAAALAGAYTLAGTKLYREPIVGSGSDLLVLLTMMVSYCLWGVHGLGWDRVADHTRILPIVRKLPIEEIDLLGNLNLRMSPFGLVSCSV